jgi:hypothetical protein
MNQTEQKVKKTNLHTARPKAACRLEAFAIMSLLILSIVLWSCSDPRNEPSTAPDSGYTQTIVLAEYEASNGQPVTMNFAVENQLAPIIRPGEDQPARLFVTASIRPDADIEWREAIISDSFPAWDDLIVIYQVAVVSAQMDIDDFTILADSCETNPECSSDSLAALLAAIADAETSRAANQDSLDRAIADTTRLGLIRDSLAFVLDDRYRLSIQFDSYPLVAYPNAFFIVDPLTHDSLAVDTLALTGQSIYLAATDSNNVKGKTFVLDMAQISAADSSNIGRPIELNWTTCTSVDRPCLSVGSHSLVMSVTGAETWVSAVLVLVYAEER